MITYKKYTKKDIKRFKKKINKITVIQLDDDELVEGFVQMNIDGQFLPYLVSTFGRIISVDYMHKKEFCKQLKTSYDEDGYEFLVINCNHTEYGFQIHRMVASTYIINDDPIHKTQVNHKDGNTKNNFVGNLEWITPKGNIHHAWETGLAHSTGEDNGNNKYKEKDIIKVCELLEKDYSMKEIQELTNVSYPIISLIYRRKNWIEVSLNYDFSSYSYGKNRKDDIHEICKLLENSDKSVPEISKICNVKRSKVYDILRGHSYKSISKNYDFSNRINNL